MSLIAQAHELWSLRLHLKSVTKPIPAFFHHRNFHRHQNLSAYVVCHDVFCQLHPHILLQTIINNLQMTPQII